VAELVPVYWAGCKDDADLIDLFRNDSPRELLKRRFQCEVGAGGDPG